ncbi:MAG: hypothetical protein M0Z54_16425 [Thermaerobacter sp.]|nr:hypothetical protein [Thermaerobacter sp.]
MGGRRLGLGVALGAALATVLALTGQLAPNQPAAFATQGASVVSTRAPDRVVIQRVILYPATIAQHPNLWHNAEPLARVNATPGVAASLYTAARQILATGAAAESAYLKAHGTSPAYSCPAGMAAIQLTFFSAGRQLAVVKLLQWGCDGETVRAAGQPRQAVGPLGIGRPFVRFLHAIAAAAHIPYANLLPRWASLPSSAP